MASVLGITPSQVDARVAIKYTKPGTGIPATDLEAAAQANLTKAATSVQPSGLTKAAVGLANVDNTSDASKPVSTAQAAAIGAKYTKPSSGIPKSDLDPAALTSLNSVDARIQNSDGSYPPVGSAPAGQLLLYFGTTAPDPATTRDPSVWLRSV